MGELKRLCVAQTFVPGERLVVDLGVYEEVLVLNLQGTVYAISNICPHAGAALQRGPIEGTVLYCPLHRWGFDLSSGRCVDDTTLCVRTYTVETHDGQLWLRLS